MTDSGSPAARPVPRRRVCIVPHTHWDREWYSSFQTFRLRLVDLLDDFLPLLEHDPGYAHFLLDGQMAVIDDYLEVRPEAEAPLRRLAASAHLRDERVQRCALALADRVKASPRETEVLALGVAHVPLDEMAERLGVTPNTVRTWRRTLLAKCDELRLSTVVGRVLEAARLGA